jgi:hypothetical protein
MNVPYNTGKVEIGKYYQKPYYVEQDNDMIDIQGWLIGDNKQAKQRYWANLLYAITLFVMAVIGLIYY